jgi:putative sigma-54 modulation protein
MPRRRPVVAGGCGAAYHQRKAEVQSVRTTIRGKNLTVSDKDRAYVERKMQRLERMLDDRSEAEVELRLEGNRKVDDSHIVDVAVITAGQHLRGVGTASSFRVAADDVIDKIERRVVEARQRPRDRRRSEQARYNEMALPMEPVDGPDDTDGAGADSKIVKTKRFAIEPMFEEDAIARMEELGHTFFIFVNAENESIAVLYRRKDGRYGLIEPAIGGAYSGD